MYCMFTYSWLCDFLFVLHVSFLMRQCFVVKPVLPPSDSLWVYSFWGCLFLAVMCKQNRKYIPYRNAARGWLKVFTGYNFDNTPKATRGPTDCTRLETLSSLNLKWLQILQQRAFPLHVAKKWGTAFPLRKVDEGLSPAFPLDLSTASVGVRQTASGDCEVTGGTDNWEMVYFNNATVILLKWKVCLKAASLCKHYVQSMSLKVADEHYRNTRFTMPLPHLSLPPQPQ